MSEWHRPAAWCCMSRWCDRGHPAFSHALRPYSVTWTDDRPGTRSRVGVDFCSWQCAQRWVMEQRTDATAATLTGYAPSCIPQGRPPAAPLEKQAAAGERA